MCLVAVASSDTLKVGNMNIKMPILNAQDGKCFFLSNELLELNKSVYVCTKVLICSTYHT
jgi:hypothetical protein